MAQRVLITGRVRIGETRSLTSRFVLSSTKIRSGSLKLVLAYTRLRRGEGFSHVCVWFWELGRL